jgi:pyridoxamine 5'-phosphate oxidase
VEVHPHAAAVQLFALDRIVKYKRGSGAERAAELNRLRSLMLDRLPELTPRLALSDLPAIPTGGKALKAVEDQIDAVTCAYVAAHWWYWGSERNDVLGDAATGYMVVPKRQKSLPVSEMREHYACAGLLEAEMDADPIAQFERWFAEARAAGVKEPNAMTLATASEEGQPSARIVLLKGVSGDGFAFYTNYESRKGRELAANPRAALVFYWAELERQVRIAGSVTRLSREESETYFHSRPRGSQLSAWASQQSETVADREVLEARVAELETKYAGGDVPLPPFWGGYCLRPAVIEYWQGRPNRLHDRLRYTRSAGGWALDRLSP